MENIKFSDSFINITKKLIEARKDIDKITKNGKVVMSNESYKYLADEDIATRLKSILDDKNILFVHGSKTIYRERIDTEKTYKGEVTKKIYFLTGVQIDYMFIDGDSGEWISASVEGQGMDTGDKGIFKAITGAIKYIYIKNFNIPTKDDPEATDENGKSTNQANSSTSGYNANNNRENKLITEQQIADIKKIMADNKLKAIIEGIETWTFAKGNLFLKQLEDQVKKSTKKDIKKTDPVETVGNKEEKAVDPVKKESDPVKQKVAEEEVSAFDILKDEFKENLE